MATRRYGGSAGIYGGAWQGPVLVLTHHPPVIWEDPAITFVSEGVGRAVAAAREAADGRDVGVLGADTARQCVEEGLVDELLVHLAPVLLGDGVRLFSRSDGGPVALERMGEVTGGQVTDLRFRVLR